MPSRARTGSRADVALLGATLLASIVVLLLPAPVRTSLHATLRDGVAAPFVALQAWAQRGRLAIADRGRLVRQVDSLALASSGAVAVQAENERLRALLGLGRRLEWGFVATELLPAPQGGDEHAVTVNAGTESGVRQFAPVVTPAGLIGVVTQVQRRTATAILWTHPDFRASATTEDGAAFGIVSSHLVTGADRTLLELRGVPFRASLKPGTVIVTSGLGQVFPKGIPIGVVLREVRTLEGWARTYLVRPMVSPGELGSAMVLLPPRAAAGVEAAWATARAAEGRQRLIVSAADSVIADSLVRIEARLRKLDSLRRAAIFAGDSGIVRELDALRGVDSTATDSLPLDSLARPVRAGAPVDTVASRSTAPALRRDTSARPAAPRVVAPRTTMPPPAATTPATAAPAPVRAAPAPRPRADSARGTVARATGAPAATPRRADTSATPRPRPAGTTPATATPAGAATARPAPTRPRPVASPAGDRRDSAAARNRAATARPRPAADSAERPFRLPDEGR